jgi:TolB protein
VTPWTTINYADHPAWSTDATRIAFTDGIDIFVIAAAGGTAFKLTNGSGWSGDPAWSPDGGQIAFVRIGGGSAEIYVMNPDGSSAWRLAAVHAYNPAWSPDT